MPSKSYEQRCARLVQEALGVPYTRALAWVRKNMARAPDFVTVNERALWIVEALERGPER